MLASVEIFRRTKTHFTERIDTVDKKAEPDLFQTKIETNNAID